MKAIKKYAIEFCEKKGIEASSVEVFVEFYLFYLSEIRKLIPNKKRKYATSEEAYQAHLIRQKQYRKNRLKRQAEALMDTLSSKKEVI